MKFSPRKALKRAVATMRGWRNLDIRASVTVMIVILAVAFVAFAGTALQSLRSVRSATGVIAANWLPSTRIAGQIQYRCTQLTLAYQSHIVATAPEDMDKAEQVIAKAKEDLARTYKSYEAMIYTPQERLAWGTLGDAVDAYQAIARPMIELSRSGAKADAAKFFAATMGRREHNVFEGAQKLIDMNGAGVQGAEREAQMIYTRSLIIFGSLALAVTAILGGGLVFMRRRVTTPITDISKAMRRLADGDLQADIPFRSRVDEIGEMAGAVEVFRQAGISRLQLQQEAEEGRERQIRLDAEQRAKESEDAERQRLVTTALGDGLRRLADGDVSVTIRQPFAPEYKSLRHDFNSSVGQLEQALSAVIRMVQNIDQGTAEISAGTDDLSKRTERQAATLQETAAALDQITVNVHQSAERSGEVQAAATLANRRAEESQQVVADTEDAIRRIEEGAKEISTIIGVIDEIAFQTNLLALNAGIEAARAGEAGRGFAVVAQEVRELAQRSASAAKDIKHLIGKSTAEVEDGDKMVRQTGSALKGISDHVSRISRLVDAIAVASREQSTGLAEVNVSVNEMDQTTQQNAAMVEESNAASAALAQDAKQLRLMLDRFKLGHALDEQGEIRRAARAGG
jgi:methyl-accepting chemotaxis protein